jgi:arabinoxylan arabinofuranohydrolase
MGVSQVRMMLRCVIGFLPALLFFGAILDLAGTAKADNPIIQTIYSADPAPVVVDNRVYLFVDHDEDGSTTYNMKDWRLFSSADMANWQDHGVVMSLATFRYGFGVTFTYSSYINI